MANNRHFWRKGEICRVMTMEEITTELRTKETGLGLWTSDSRYGELILAFMPTEYKNMGRVGEIVKAEYDYYATVEFVDGKRFEIPCMCLKVVEPTISGKCISLKDLADERNRLIEPTPINIDDIVDLELNDFSDISEEFFAYGIKLEDDVEDNNDDLEDIEEIKQHKLFDTYAEVIKVRNKVEEALEQIDKLIKDLEDLM